MFDGLVVMSGGHCTHLTGGPAIRLKHKNNPDDEVHRRLDEDLVPNMNKDTFHKSTPAPYESMVV